MADKPRTALLIIDVQNDFCQGGALEVPQGDIVIPALNRFAERIKAEGGVVCASRDWHPARSAHFKAFGGTWPVHCVADTPGAGFHPDLRLPPDAVVISTGQEEGQDGYSAFEGVTDSGQPLAAALRSLGVEHLYVGGLATDYCVKHSVLDALKAGFSVTVLIDAIAGIDAQPGDSARALNEMEEAGAKFMATQDQTDT